MCNVDSRLSLRDKGRASRGETLKLCALCPVPLGTCQLSLSVGTVNLHLPSSAGEPLLVHRGTRLPVTPARCWLYALFASYN